MGVFVCVSVCVSVYDAWGKLYSCCCIVFLLYNERDRATSAAEATELATLSLESNEPFTHQFRAPFCLCAPFVCVHVISGTGSLDTPFNLWGIYLNKKWWETKRRQGKWDSWVMTMEKIHQHTRTDGSARYSSSTATIKESPKTSNQLFPIKFQWIHFVFDFLRFTAMKMVADSGTFEWNVIILRESLIIHRFK